MKKHYIYSNIAFTATPEYVAVDLNHLKEFIDNKRQGLIALGGDTITFYEPELFNEKPIFYLDEEVYDLYGDDEISWLTPYIIVKRYSTVIVWRVKHDEESKMWIDVDFD